VAVNQENADRSLEAVRCLLLWRFSAAGRIVFVAEIGVLSSAEIDRIMKGCIEAGAK
jgi:hypothetical protein